MGALIPINDFVVHQQIAHYRARRQALVQTLAEHETSLRSFETQRNEALKCYESNIQEHFAALVKLRLDHAKTTKASTVAAPQKPRYPAFLFADDQAKTDMRLLYYATASLLFSNGQCLEKDIFNQAEKAYKSGDFSLLYKCYSKAIDTIAERTGLKNKQLSPREQLKMESQHCKYLEYAIDVIKQKIEKVICDPLYIACALGNEHFASYCEAAIAAITYEISMLQESMHECPPTGEAL